MWRGDGKNDSDISGGVELVHLIFFNIQIDIFLVKKTKNRETETTHKPYNYIFVKKI